MDDLPFKYARNKYSHTGDMDDSFQMICFPKDKIEQFLEAATRVSGL